MWSIIAGAAVVVALVGTGVWIWRLHRQVTELRQDVADAVKATNVVRRSKRAHLRRLKALVPFAALGAAGRQVRHHPIVAGAASAAGATALLVSVAALDGPSGRGEESRPRAIEVIDPPERRDSQRPDSGSDEDGEAEVREEQPAVADDPTLEAAAAEPEPASIDGEVMESTEPEPVVDGAGPVDVLDGNIGDDIPTDVLTPKPPELPPGEVPPPTTEPPELNEPVSEPTDNDPTEATGCLIDKVIGGGVAELELCLNPPGQT